MSNRHRILLQVASISIALALGSACATTPSGPPYTADNVSTTAPFGTTDITPAGGTPQSVGNWYYSQTPAQQADLQGRCNVVNTFPTRYPVNAAMFCWNVQTAQYAQYSLPPSAATL